MVFGLNFEKIRARLVRATWGKSPDTKKIPSKPTKKRSPPPKHHWLSPNYGAGSTPNLSRVPSLDLNNPEKRDSVHNLQELDPSWSSRRKSSLNRISAINMPFVEEVRLPKHHKQYQYVPLVLDLSSDIPFANQVNSEGIEMELDTDFERRASVPKSPRKSMPSRRIGPAPPIPATKLSRAALELQRTMTFKSAVDEMIAENQTFEPRPLFTRKLKPAPLDLSARRGSSDRVSSTYYTPGWTSPIYMSPSSKSTRSGSIFSRRGSSSRQSSADCSSPLFSPTDTRPIQILRPSAKQSVQCVLSESPTDGSWVVRMYPDSPRSIASRSTTASKTTAARWFATVRRNEDWDF